MLGHLLSPALSGYLNPKISSDLRLYAEDVYAPLAYAGALYLTGPRVAAFQSYPVAVSVGRALRTYFDDFYFRIHVFPANIDLGNLVSDQVRQIYVWNAWPNAARTLTATNVIDGDGIEVSLPGALPLAFAPLQERLFEVTVNSGGPPVIDAELVFTFTGLDDITVTIVGNRLLAWPLPPDWGEDINETLAFLTDVQQAINGDRTTIPCRDAPRRQWEFSVIGDRRERRIVENMLYDWTARIWSMPVWPDVTRLAAILPAGSTSVPVITTGLDFRVGGLAMLWSDVQRFELIEVGAIAIGSIDLVRPTLREWPRGACLYPCRNTQLVQAPELERLTDQVIKSRIRMASAEPCDWPAIAPAATYLGIPVLEHRTAWGETPRASFDRQTVRIDGDVGLVDLDDISGLAWPRQTHQWILHGRSERAAHRSLLYWLQGQAQALWLPSGTDDAELVEPAGSGADALVIAWAGIAQFLRQQTGRRHVRIELFTGQVFYRRVTGAQEIDEARERLQLESALGIEILPQQVRQISWMVLASLEGDAVEIAHVHDSEGIARSRVGFVAVGAEEP